MRQLRPDELGTPKEGETTAQYRFVNSAGETEVWIVDLKLSDLVRMEPVLQTAFIDDQVDIRIGNQAASIERLTKHLTWHHDELGQLTADSCTYNKRIQSGFEEIK